MFVKNPVRAPLISTYNVELLKLIQKQRELYDSARRTYETAGNILKRAKPLLDQMAGELAELEKVRDDVQRILREATKNAHS